MNKGDTLRLNLDFIDDDGNPIAEGQYSEMELQLNPDRIGVFSMKFLLSEGDIQWDEETSQYFVLIDQEDSFKLPNHVQYQLRCMNDDGVVISSEVSSFCIGNVLSSNILSDAESN